MGTHAYDANRDEFVDLQELPSDQLREWFASAIENGDADCVETIQMILAERGETA